ISVRAVWISSAVRRGLAISSRSDGLSMFVAVVAPVGAVFGSLSSASVDAAVDAVDVDEAVEAVDAVDAFDGVVDAGPTVPAGGSVGLSDDDGDAAACLCGACGAS